MSTGVKKLQEEYIFLRKNPVLSSIGGTVRPVQNDFLHWFGSIKGQKILHMKMVLIILKWNSQMIIQIKGL